MSKITNNYQNGSSETLHKIALVNTQTLHAMYGYGTGKTEQEAIDNALEIARKRDPNARYFEGQVWFAGGINC